MGDLDTYFSGRYLVFQGGISEGAKWLDCTVQESVIKQKIRNRFDDRVR